MKLRTLLTASTLLLLPLSTMAQNGKGFGPYTKGTGGGYEQSNEKRGERLREELGLSEKQFTQLDELKRKHFEEMKTSRESIRTLRKEVREELKKDKPNLTSTNKTSDKIGNTHAKMSKAMVTHLLEIKKILNKEQFNKLLDFHKRDFRKGGNKHKKGNRGKGNYNR